MECKKLFTGVCKKLLTTRCKNLLTAECKEVLTLPCKKLLDIQNMGNFYRVPSDNRGLNYDKFFTEGNLKKAQIKEFNSNNTRRLNLEETKAKIASLQYIQDRLNEK